MITSLKRLTTKKAKRSSKTRNLDRTSSLRVHDLIDVSLKKNIINIGGGCIILSEMVLPVLD
jgi:hypothetical protein